MKGNKYALIIGVFVFCSSISVVGQKYLPPGRVANDFAALLERPHVSPKPALQTIRTDSVLIERGFFYSEETEKVPLLIYKPLTSKMAYPVIICLYGTGGSMASLELKQMLFHFSKLGFMAVSIDARFHGERAKKKGSASYIEAITDAWKNQDAAHQTHPFFYDTVYDLWRLTDYLVTRADVEPQPG